MLDEIRKIGESLNYLKQRYSMCNQLVLIVLKGIEITLIEKLQGVGMKYNPELKYEDIPTSYPYNTEYKKFFAFKVDDYSKFTNQEILNKSNEIFNLIIEKLANAGLEVEELEFSIPKIEQLRDKASFSDLVRGIVIWRKRETTAEDITDAQIDAAINEGLATGMLKKVGDNEFALTEKGQEHARALIAEAKNADK